jgi:hypothetical protein
MATNNSAMQFWKQELKWFLVKHPFFEKNPEKIYTPKKGLSIRFWIEGNLQIEGVFENLEINYNNSKLLVLATRGNEGDRIFRVQWNRIVAFELFAGKDATDEIKKLLNISPVRKN